MTWHIFPIVPRPETGYNANNRRQKMEFTIGAAFLIGVFVGMFGGTLVISLCAMAGHEESSLEAVPSTAAK
jgi:hypothetical protein